MSFIIVHLTDIHMKHSESDNPILDKVDKICSALNGTVMKDDTVLLAFTGDLAFSGQKSEYNNCELLINKVYNHLREERQAKIYVGIVPGNHDCDFLGNQEVRNVLISSLKNKTAQLTNSIATSISDVQKNFFEFSERNGNFWEDITNSSLVFETDIGRVCVTMLNTAWDSSRHEESGQLLMPKIVLNGEDINNSVLSLGLMHHPLHWMSPECNRSLSGEFRKSIDMIFVGHEHHDDKFTKSDENWSYSQYSGKELQNSSKADDSSFSVYIFDSPHQMKRIEFTWNVDDSYYYRVAESLTEISSNQKRSRCDVYPNKSTIEMLSDIGASIHHFRIDAINLEELFCWPELDVLPASDSKTKNVIRITDDIPQYISQSRVPLLVGSPHCGKTSLLKSLFSFYLSQGICCLSCNGRDLVSPTEAGTTNIIEDLFCRQYERDKLELFRQMSTSNKVLLIDDFESMTINHDRQSRIIDHLLECFERVVLFSGSDAELSMLLAIHFNGGSDRVVPLRIRQFGNKKRQELIERWYSLGDQYALEDLEMKTKADQARDTIDSLLGNHKTIVPATPIVIISILQNIEAFGTNAFSGSQYGYLYENLVNRSLAAVKHTNPGMMNIHIAVLSGIAYNMLIGKKKSFSELELVNLVRDFMIDKLVPVDAMDLLSKMMGIRLIKKDNEGKGTVNACSQLWTPPPMSCCLVTK